MRLKRGNERFGTFRRKGESEAPGRVGKREIGSSTCPFGSFLHFIAFFYLLFWGGGGLNLF